MCIAACYEQEVVRKCHLASQRIAPTLGKLPVFRRVALVHGICASEGVAKSPLGAAAVASSAVFRSVFVPYTSQRL